MKKVLLFVLTTILISQKLAAQTYCTPQFGDAYDACYLYSINIANLSVTGELGTSINDNSGCGGSGFEDNSGSMSVTLAKGTNYTVSVASGFATNVDNLQMWIDFNDDGIFQTSESVGGINGLAPAGTFTLSVPSGVNNGTYRMRALLVYNSYASYPTINPCGSSSSYLLGDAHDYSVTIIVPPVTVTTTPSSLAFGGVTSGTSSTAQTFSFNGINLVPTAGTFTVTAPTGFKVSSTGSGWGTSYTVPYSAGTLPATTVYVQFDPTSPITYGGNVTISGGGLASPINEPVSGTGANACTGTPTAGTSAISPGFGSSLTSFTLSLSGYTVSGGITYQWQSSPDGVTYSNIAGATLASYTFSGLTANTYFQCVETCPSYGPATSTASYVTYIPAVSCYPTASSWFGEGPGTLAGGVDAFSITGYGGSTLTDAGITTSASTSTGYLDRTSMTPVNLLPGSSFASSATFGTSYVTDDQELQVWIDFNNDGIFQQSEEVTPVSGYSSSSTPSPVNFNITIPLTANPGEHLMRIRGIYEYYISGFSLSTDLDPCLVNFDGGTPQYFSGDVVDYRVNILPPPPTVISTPTSLAFGGVTEFTSSTSQTFSFNGVYLLPSTGTFTVTAPSGFEVSSDGSTWVGSYTIPYSSGAIGATTVYVEFNPTALSPYSDNVVISGGGLSPVFDEPVTGTGAIACNGTPTAGTSVVAPTYGNATTPFALSLTGNTIAGGLTYQWQSSTDGVTYTNISGATLAAYNFTGITASTYYECVQTCPTYAPASSTPAEASFIPAITCIPTSSSWEYESGNDVVGVDAFNITGYSGSTLSDAGIVSACNPTTGYVDRTSMTPVVLQGGGVFASSVNFYIPYFLQEVQVWIDFNDDGTFQQSEEVSPVSGYSASSTANPVNFNITIPASANPGVHLMRMRGVFEYFYGYGLSTDLDPCLLDFNGTDPMYDAGTVADYIVDVLPTPPTVVTTPTSLSFGGVSVSTTSSAQTFSVTGSYLVPAAGTFTVTAPAGFAVSADGSTWVPNFTVAYSGSSLPSTTVYVDFTPTTIATYSDNVTINGGGLSATANEPVSGVGALPCNATPTAGAATITPTYGNASTAFALSLMGNTISGGITYQWQSSPDGVTYSPIPGATLAIYDFTGILANSYFNCVETCPTYPSATSDSAFATFIPIPTCFPTSSSWENESGSAAYGIDVLSISGYGGSTLNDGGMTSACDPVTGYLDRTSMTPVTMQDGGVYAGSASFGSNYYAQEFQMWIDFNNDGTFDQSEEVTPVLGYSSSYTPYNINFNVTIPLNGNPGEHLMRIRGIWEDFSFGAEMSTDLDPCLVNFGGSAPYYWAGDVVDYVVNILVAPPQVTTTPSSLAFGGVSVSTTSAPQTFSVTGSYLVPSAGTFTVTAPANFAVSPDGITYSPSFTVSYSGGTLPSTLVYANFTPTAIATYSDNITILGGGLLSAANEPVGGVGALPCSATPIAGAASITPTYGNTTTAFGLSLTGNTIAGGITYQWESSPDGVTYSPISGASLAVYNFTGITANTYFNCVETCPTYPNSTSDSAYATYIPIPTCFPTAASWEGESGDVSFGVDVFNITGYGSSTLSDAGMTSACNPITGYLDRTSMTPVTMQGGGVYASSASFSGSFSTSGQELQVWIDFNNDGTFDQSEEVSPVSGYVSTGSYTSNPVDFNITIPLTANPGEHLMRIRGIWEDFSFGSSLSTDLDPCLVNFDGSAPYYWSGDVVDYVVNILVAPPQVTTTPSSLAFGGVSVSTTSSPQTFSVTGSYLVPSAGTFTITAPANFAVSPDGISWSPSYTVNYSSGSLPSTTVYVDFTPTTIATYSDNVTISGGGLSSAVNEPVSGIGALPCAATPTPGSAVVAPTYGNATTPFALSLTGNTIAGGITYQWQSSPDGVTYTPISGATLAGYNFTGISSNTYFNCVETCPTYPTSTADSALATYLPLPTCLPTASSWVYENGNQFYGVDAFNITGYSGSTLSDAGITFACNPNTGYLDRTSLTPVNLQQQGVYASSSNFYYNYDHQELQVWIDFNNNGTFEQSEEVTPVTGYTTSYFSNPVNYNITIPLNANPGIHLMRIRGILEYFYYTLQSTDLDPCLIDFNGTEPEYSAGTVADYLVNIVPLPACTGTPTAGTISADTSIGCGSYTSTLSLVGSSDGSASGLTYQWQTSPDCTTWTPISGATNDTYDATLTGTINYNCVITCTNSSMSAATPCYQLTVNPLPAGITGITTVCAGGASTLSSTSSGGTWSSNNTSVASVDGSGDVTTGSSGVTSIVYTLPTGCTTSTTFTSSPLPDPITITPSTFASVCAGDSASFTAGTTIASLPLLSENFNSGLDGWSVINTGAASVWNWAVTAPGSLTDQPGLYGDGSNFMAADADLAGFVTLTTSLISPSFSTVGYSSASLAYNEFYRSYGSDINVEVDYSVDGGSTWNTVVDQIYIDDENYTWSVGSPNITAALPAGALGQPNVLLRWYYNSYFGYQWAVDNVVVNATPTLSYAWTGLAGATGLSCSACASTTITPTAGGANVYSVTASSSAGCTSAAGVTVSVNPIPASISGTLSACASGGTTILSDITGGGTWSSDNTSVATIDPSSGTVTGVTAGTADITYTTAAGCTISSVVTINPVPVSITGTPSVCVGSSTQLSDGTTGGSWSSGNTSAATVDPASGLVSGVAQGSATITYTLPAGCTTTADVVVNPLPGEISGDLSVCVGLTTNLSDNPSGGTWSTGSTSVATIGISSGVVTGVASGTMSVTYSLVTGCSATAVVQVNPAASPITGGHTVCTGSTTSLSDGSTGGTWSSSNTSAATIDPSSGVVTGVAIGTTTITYSLPTGCTITLQMTVNPTPSAISGTLMVCPGLTTDLYDGITGGTWTSSVTGVAIIGSLSGIVTGESAGTTSISYIMSTGCSASAVLTVDGNPTGITGVRSVCIGSITSLSDGTPGGTWVSSNSNATVDGSGDVQGVTAGTATISYFSGICYSTTTVTVNPLPLIIMGSTTVCVGSTASLSDATLGGTWSSTDVTIATVGSTGYYTTVSGIATGTTTIIYTLPVTGCTRTFDLTVNPITPVLGGGALCVGSTATLSDTTGTGTWSSSAVTKATVGSTTGIVTGVASGTAKITYTTTLGCSATFVETINPISAILGDANVCLGGTTSLSDATAGGTWSSNNTSIATFAGTSGVVTGVAPGSTTVTYTIASSGCMNVATIVVNPITPIIGAPTSVCVGGTTTLSDATSGGVWSSSIISKATVGSISGTVTGISTGTVTITYLVTATGCKSTATVSVAPISAILGSTMMCSASTITLSDATAGGTWSSSNTSAATVGVSGSPVTVVGVSPGGITTITYATSGCSASITLTVNQSPVIGGTNAVCVGLITTLTDNISDGTWTSSNTAKATVDESGDVTGLAAGTSIISYMATTGCSTSMVVTVNANPAAILGGSLVCAGSVLSLSDATAGGSWTTTSGVSLTGSGGSVTGVIAGSATVTYTLPTGCLITKNITVAAPPTTINGGNTICAGNMLSLTDGITGGTWASSNISNATIGSSSGILTGMQGGTANITYTTASGCYVTTVVTVNAIQAITGGANVCTGSTLSLSDMSSGGTWSTPSTTISIGSTGLVSGLSAGTATVVYTLPSGCSRSVTIAVNPTPIPITGALTLCDGATTTLSDDGSGVWSMSSIIATIVGSTGVVTASNTYSGTATVTYTAGAGCMVTAVVTVSPNPATIQANVNECAGATITLSDATPGGTWTGSGDATVSGSGSTGTLIAGGAAGSAIITYSLPGGCYITSLNTVKATPTAILGTTTICVGGITILSDATTGTASWSSSNTTIASAAGGDITGIGAGVANITFTISSTGCSTTTSVNVLTASAITGNNNAICPNTTLSLTDAAITGTWSSSNSTIAAVGTDGTVTSHASGTATITFVTAGVSGCVSTTVVTVSATPTITGATSLCSNTSITLNDASSGGTWTSSNTSVATISSGGTVSGVGAGTVTISYAALTGCTVISTLTVNAAPGPVNGNTSICIGTPSTLSDAVSGGIWSSSVTGHATVGASTGIVTGITAGSTTTITYSAGGCFATATVSINAQPGAILGSTTVCAGSTISLSNTTPGGSWTSSGVGSVGSTGIFSGGLTPGTTSVSYTTAAGCGVTDVVTTNSAPGPLAGPTGMCAGATITLSDAITGGTWAASSSLASVDGSGDVTADSGATGAVTITYTLPGGCFTTSHITVTNLPSAILGSRIVCAGGTVSLSNTTSGGVWSSGLTSIATVGSTGIVTGVTTGVGMITYTVGSGCSTSETMTVNPVPQAITGSTTICEGSTSALVDTGSGTWSITSSLAATINSVTGLVTASSAYTGTAIVTYTAAYTGCRATLPITVVAKPSSILGAGSACAGTTITLVDATAGGTWSGSGDATVSGAGTSGTLVAGAIAGTASVTYTITSSCVVMATTTIYASPLPIMGNFNLCVGLVTDLSDASPVSSWSSSNTAVAIASGPDISGESVGTATITFVTSAAGNCKVTQVVTVNAMPAITPINGPATISHTGGPVSISDATPGGIWSSSNPSVIALSGSTGSPINASASLTTGSSTISYAVTIAGCTSKVTKVINAATAPHPAGTASVIAGSAVTLADDFNGGLWNSSDNGIATVDGSGLVTGIVPGSVIITHEITGDDGSVNTSVTNVTVTAIPASVNVLPNPNKGTFTVKGTVGSVANEEVTLEVTDLLGQVIYRSKVTAEGGRLNETIILSSTLANGMYILNVKSGTENKTFHFVIEQ